MSKFILIVCIILAILVIAIILFTALGGQERFKVDIGGQTPRAAGGGDTSSQKGFKSRIIGQGLISGGLLGILLAKLWSMQLISSDEYAKKAELNRTRVIKTPAPRGRILDRNGVELVNNRPCLTVVAMPEVLDDPLEIQLLANLLGMPTMAVKRKIQDQTEGAQSARIVAMDVSRRTIAYIGEHADVFKNVHIEERTQRNYPYGSLAAHVLGYTGPVTQEQLDAYKANQDEGAIEYSHGDIVGQAGVEFEYESVLQGVRGEQIVFVDANGKVTDYSNSVPAVAGSDVVLSLDVNVQKAAEKGLEHALDMAHKQGNTKARSACSIIMKAKTGEIVAMASMPTFSPSVFVGGISNHDWSELSSDASGWPLMNRAISGQFMAASTIKPLSVFAALDYGMADHGSTYNCTGFWTGFGSAYGKYCWDHAGHGIMDLESGITYSCDVVFYEIGKAFFESDTPEGLQMTYRRWGLGKPTGIDLPGEAQGRIPDAQWKWNHFTNAPDQDRMWQGGDTTNIAIGQGDILVTPIQMACVYMGLANRGDMWRPHVMKSVTSQNAQGTIIDYEDKVYLDPEEKDDDRALVSRGLNGVIYKESPAITAHFKNLGVEVEGKTGTGERAQDDAPTGWFCAYAPAKDPEYVGVALVENGGFGSTTAMFAVRDAFGEIYDAPDDVFVPIQNVQ